MFPELKQTLISVSLCNKIKNKKVEMKKEYTFGRKIKRIMCVPNVYFQKNCHIEMM